MHAFNAILVAVAISWQTCKAVATNFTDIGQPYGLTSFGIPVSIRDIYKTSNLVPFISKQLHAVCLPHARTREVRFAESISLQAMPDQNFLNGTQLLIVHVDYYDSQWDSVRQDVIGCVVEQISNSYGVAAGSNSKISPPTVERLFFWLDTDRQIDENSQKINMTSFAFKLSAENATKMRILVQGMRSGGYFPGLAERARAVGYFSESMHLQPLDDGTYLLLVHLDHFGSFETLNTAIAAYPGNYFTTYWGPQYASIIQNPFVETQTVSTKTFDLACKSVTWGVREPWECVRARY